jgi:xanthine dehydrogenase molybdopterin-binding subunit B
MGKIISDYYGENIYQDWDVAKIHQLMQPPEDPKAIGVERIPRKDGWEKATGTGTYTRDVLLPGMLYAKMYVNPHAAAIIKSIDTSAAEALPG